MSAIQQLQELKEFFAHPREDVRLEALKLFSGFTRDASNRDDILSLDIVRFLLPRISDSPSISEQALTCTINLAETAALRHQMLSQGVINICMGELRNSSNAKNRKYIVMLLSNLSMDDTGSKALMQEESPLSGLHMRRLLNWFCEAPIGDDPYEFVGNVLTNISTLESARTIFLDKQRAIIPALITHLDAKSTVRRLGVFRCIRNLFMDTQNHAFLLSDDLLLWANMMLPIVGSENLDAEDQEGLPSLVIASLGPGKKRDPNPEVRKIILDIVYLCARHKPSRLTIKPKKIYVLLRELHLWEQEMENTEHDEFIEDLVQYFLLPEDDVELKEGKAKAEEAKVVEVFDDEKAASEKSEKSAAPVTKTPEAAPAVAATAEADSDSDEPPPFLEDM